MSFISSEWSNELKWNKSESGTEFRERKQRWRTSLHLESKNQFSTRISPVNVTFEFILCSISEKAVTVLHNLYVTNHWRLFGIGADSLDTGNGLNSHRDQEWSPFNQPAGRSIDAFWDFFSDWNFFADPKFFFCLRNLGGSGNRKQTTFFSRP